MKEPNKIPLTDNPRSKEPKRIPLTSKTEEESDKYHLNENNQQNDQTSIQELESDKIN